MKMSDFIHKAMRRGLSAGNIMSWLCLEGMRVFGTAWGTARLRCKAALFGVPVGRGTRAHGPVALMRWPGGRIRIGENVSLISSWRRATAATLAAPVRLRVFGPGADIEVGDGAELSGTSITARSTRVAIGRGVMIAPNCVITDSDFHALWPPEARRGTPGYECDAPVTVGDYAWIGMNCLVLKGVNIGEGAVVGAGSVVTRNVPPRCLAAGVPARVVRQLDTEALSEEKTHFSASNIVSSGTL
jgi:carbonic anhydrase/acetyltransferase-like protein (isoleucine patch superfamily)